MPTLFAVTVDTEEEWDWDAGWPTGDLFLRNIGQLPRFQDLCDQYGITPTYFTNLAVLDDNQSQKILLELSRHHGTEIGMHIHPWNTPPLKSSGPVTARDTFLHNYPADEIVAKLDSVYQRFREMGLTPTSFRGGRYSSGGAIHSYLQKHGFVADSSVVPFSTWEDEGAPDFRDRNLEPRRINPRAEGEEPLWEVPLTMAFTRKSLGFWHGVYERIERGWLGKLRLIGIMEKLGLVRKIWLNFEVFSAKRMLELLKLLRSWDLPFICLTVHSSSLMAGGNPYTPDAIAEERIFDSCKTVFEHLASWDQFQPATITQIAQQLEEEYASHRNQSPG